MKPSTQPPSPLLIAIQCLINENGGADKYANAIETEWARAPIRIKTKENYPQNLLSHWQEDEVKILKAYYPKNNIKVLMKLLPHKSREGIHGKISSLIRQGKMAYKSKRWRAKSLGF